MCDHRNSAPHCSSPFFLGNYSDVRRDYRIGHCLYPTCSIAVMGLGFWFKVSVALRPLLTATLKDVVARRPVATTIHLTVPAGGARPAPPVGPALGQYRLNLMAFCKDFNARTQKYKPDTPMAVTITAYKDNTFEFTVKTPSVTWFLKQAAGVEFGSGRPGHVAATSLTLRHVYEIAKIKQTDFSCKHLSIEAICKSIIGTARSMGIDIVKDL